MSRPVRIRRIEFHNFKALAQFKLSINDVNVIVGPNNSGKSTIVGALRTLDAALRFARSRPPTRVYVGDDSFVGYRIPLESVPISLENVQTNYNGVEAHIAFNLSNGHELRLIFPEDGGCVLKPVVDGEIIRNTSAFKRAFPISLIVVPVLGPVEHRERLRERSTVIGGLSTHRASRHFRSYWRYFPNGFDAFSDLVKKTWPNMEISTPELDSASGELSMFCVEDRITRELYWVGYGFQIWCQLLTHISRANENSLLVVDEPEVYLHPDIQRQLLSIVRDCGCDVLLSTHSSEIVSEADPTELIMIDKRRRQGDRLRNISDVQRALDAVGSAQNITLTALARSRRILFVEDNDDFRLLRRIARKMGFQELSSGIDIIPLASGGFGSWNRITILASGIAEALGSPLTIGAIYDRDYYCDEQIDEVLKTLDTNLQLSSVLLRKELENYLLIPNALDRAALRLIGSDKKKDVEGASINSSSILEEITDKMRDDILAHRMARKEDYVRSRGEDRSRIFKSVMVEFESKWSNIEGRLSIAPGKEVLRLYRKYVQDLFGITLTDARIVDAMGMSDIPDDMKALIQDLDTFRTHSQEKQ